MVDYLTISITSSQPATHPQPVITAGGAHRQRNGVIGAAIGPAGFRCRYADSSRSAADPISVVPKPPTVSRNLPLLARPTFGLIGGV